MRSRLNLIFLLLPILIAESGACGELEKVRLEFFERKIRPVLADRCFKCHSADSEKLKGGLQVDHLAYLLKGGESGPAIVEGDPGASRLIEALHYGNPDLQMPPKSKLPGLVVADFEKWIADGAAWPDEKLPKRNQGSQVKTFDLEKRRAEHWCWRPVEDPVPPPVKNTDWPKSPIDQFILSRIESAGLRPALPADRRVWLRRVYFDLIGLPPSPKQLEDFVEDKSESAYRRVVDELLASPGFGENWARHWMDLVRYADTYGHEFDYPIRYAFEYRDYLIRAFNEDVPYDLFVKEQIAGDLLDKPRWNSSGDFNESVLGTGFWFLYEATHAPTDVRADECDHMDNQLDVFGKSFLGLTISCARCHDHKFDAISAADYYSLTSYLKSSLRQEISVDPGQTREKTAQQQRELRRRLMKNSPGVSVEAEKSNRPGSAFLAAAHLARVKASKSEVATAEKQQGFSAGTVSAWIRLFEAASSSGQGKEKPQAPNEWLSTWVEKPAMAVKEIGKIKRNQAAEQSFLNRGKVFADFSEGKLPNGWVSSGTAFSASGDGGKISFGPKESFAWPGCLDGALLGDKPCGVLRSPSFVIESGNINVRLKSDRLYMRVIMDNYQMAQFNGLLFKGTTLKQVNTGGEFQWVSLGGDLKKYIGHRAYLEFVDGGSGTTVIDEIRLSSENAPPGAGLSMERILLGDGSPTTIEEVAANLDGAWTNALDEWRDGKLSFPSVELLNWLAKNGLINLGELFGKSFRDGLTEGRNLASQLPPPRFAIAMAESTPENSYVHIRGNYRNRGMETPPRFLEALGGKKGNRLVLASQVAAAEDPLTSRVIVNRLWYHLFGRGIVPTPDDFGPMGQPPSHPELLDWLASDLVKHSWSLKHTIREIVLSRTYQQSCNYRPELSRELIAEKDPSNHLLCHMPVRRLTAEQIRDGILTVSGRLDRKMYGPGVPTYRTAFMTGRGGKKSGPLDGYGRRSIYGAVYRNFLSPFLLTFDMPNPFGPKGRRSVSNVPAQALTLMNDPFVIQQSELWASKIFKDEKTAKEQRIQTMFEEVTGQPLGEDRQKKLTAFLEKQSRVYGKLDERAWADLAHVLFNLKEFIYLE